jgi:hypothetical protein
MSTMAHFVRSIIKILTGRWNFHCFLLILPNWIKFCGLLIEFKVSKLDKIGLGGSCRWCTEAIFLSITGVSKVDQGWISPKGDESAFSEAVIVEFCPDIISFDNLVGIHLHSHSCTSVHNMRSK